MMIHHWRCIGSVRPDCGVAHRTIEAAVKCKHRDQRSCEKQGGYSDRSILPYDSDDCQIDIHDEDIMAEMTKRW